MQHCSGAGVSMARIWEGGGGEVQLCPTTSLRE